MKKINFFKLIESSVMLLPKMSKKIWIIGVIIAILSGGLIINESYDTYDEGDYYYSEGDYSEEATETLSTDEYYTEDDSNFFGSSLLIVVLVVLLGLAIIAFLAIGLGVLISIATYYLSYNIYKIIFNEEIERASLSNLVKINTSIILRVIGGTILFVVPGIIAGLKYAPVNYILCKNPDMEPKDVLKETKTFSHGFKWKIFKYSLAVELVFVILMLVSSPDLLAYGYILLDILSMIINLLMLTLSVVFSGIFGMKLYDEMKDIKNINNEIA